MHFVGIDWADDDHSICVLSEEGKVVSQFKIANDLLGFHELEKVLQTLSPTKISIERVDGLLVDYLSASDHDVYIVPPRATAAKRGRKSKHDKADAHLLANLLRTDDIECRPLCRPSPLVMELKHKVRLYDLLTQDQRRYGNRLHHILKMYYPNMRYVFSKITRPIAIDFMKRFPDADTVRNTPYETFATFFDGRNYNSKHKIPEFYKILCAPTQVSSDPVGYRYQMFAQVAILEALNAQLFPLEKEIEQLLNQHPEADWWQHFPGVGAITAARLLAYVGDNRNKYPTYQILQATAGTVPITQQSGRKNVVKFRKACSKPLRKAVTDWAYHSLRYSMWAKVYYNQQRARGHGKERAYRALGARVLDIVAIG